MGPKGEIELQEGVIAAKRHIHMTPADAEAFGVENGQIVSVQVENGERSLTFGDVVVRVSDKYALAMHIDTDESNAACVTPGTCLLYTSPPTTLLPPFCAPSATARPLSSPWGSPPAPILCWTCCL